MIQRFFIVIMFALQGAFLSALPAVAQPDTLWTRGIIEGGYPPGKLILNLDGGFAVCGEKTCGDEERRDTDFTLVKTDSVGNLLWNQYYPSMPNGRHQRDNANSLFQLPDSGFILVGGGGGGSMPMMVRTDSEGELAWLSFSADEYNIRYIYDCAPAENDEFLIVSSDDVAKIDGEGEVVWHQCFDENRSPLLLNILKDRNDEFLITGRIDRGEGDQIDMYAVKMNTEGEVIWEQSYGTALREVCAGAVQTSDGGYCLVGTQRFGMSDSVQAMIVRIDPEGELIWQRIYDEFYRGITLVDIVQTSDGGFAAGGTNDYDLYLFRVDSEGEYQWRESYGIGYAWERFSSMLLMNDGGYLLCGSSTDYGTWLVRTAPDPLYNGVELLDPAFPNSFAVQAPYPNPFNSTVTIGFDLPRQENVRVAILDMNGREIGLLVNSNLNAGHHKFAWNAETMPAGVYFLNLSANGLSNTKKVALVK